MIDSTAECPHGSGLCGSDPRGWCSSCPNRQNAQAVGALDAQIGGAHYKSMPIQPVEFIHKNGIPWCEANAIKYLCRWRQKSGIEDLKKARHYIDLLIEMEGQ